MSDLKILGDWGTSSCRLYLCDGETILESTKGPGVKFTNNPELSFIECIRPWINQYGQIPSILCGMIGSNIGWKEVPYAKCPATARDLINKITTFYSENGLVHIVPGLRTDCNLLGVTDVMRGEETQIFGWLATHEPNGLLCLPGTHTKWVQTKEGAIINFATSVTGELFEIVTKHSVLIGSDELPNACIGDEFRRGVETSTSDFALSYLLMTVRSLQLSGEYDKIQAKNYLLGLLIGADVKTSMSLAETTQISVIGGSTQANFYAETIQYMGGKVKVYGEQEASLDGLRYWLSSLNNR